MLRSQAALPSTSPVSRRLRRQLLNGVCLSATLSGLTKRNFSANTNSSFLAGQGLWWSGRHFGCTWTHRPSVPARAGDPGGSEQGDPSLDPNFVLVGHWTVWVGLQGCLALAAARLLQVDPWALCHWEPNQLLLALGMVTPLLLIDVALMVPDWGPRTFTQRVRLGPRGWEVAEAEPAMGEGAGEALELSQEERQGALREALHRFQQESTLGDARMRLSLWPHMGLGLGCALANELLERVVLLMGVSQWLVDRMFQAGLELDAGAYHVEPTVVKLLGIAGHAPSELPLLMPWLLLYVGCWGRLMDLMQQLVDARHPSSGVPVEAAEAASTPGDTDTPQAVQQGGSGLIRLAPWRDLLAWLQLGSALLLTGNLAASFAAAALRDSLFILYQHHKVGGLKEAWEARLRQVQRLSALQQEHRIARLAPPTEAVAMDSAAPVVECHPHDATLTRAACTASCASAEAEQAELAELWISLLELSRRGRGDSRAGDSCEAAAPVSGPRRGILDK